jgi:DNA-binding Lrp family transcriptional regulator
MDVNTDSEDIVKELSGIKGVTEVYEVTGDQDVVVVVDVDSSQKLNEIVDKIRRLKCILSTRTRLILKEHTGE